MEQEKPHGQEQQQQHEEHQKGVLEAVKDVAVSTFGLRVTEHEHQVQNEVAEEMRKHEREEQEKAHKTTTTTSAGSGAAASGSTEPSFQDAKQEPQQE